MTILVTGATGRIGSLILERLAGQGAEVRGLTRSPEKAGFPSGVSAVKGDMSDVDSLRAALDGVDTLFLLNAISRDELTQALMTLNIAIEKGVKGIVYWSVLHSELYTNVPQLAAKFAVERMIEQFDMPATILRPSTFMQNDLRFKGALVGKGVYPFPIGSAGVSMVDIGDLCEIAAGELLRRDRAGEQLPREAIDLAGPGNLTGPEIAAIWSDILGRPVGYNGDDTAATEQGVRAQGSAWMAYFLVLLLRRFQRDGVRNDGTDVERTEAMLGRKLRRYREFAQHAANGWSMSGSENPATAEPASSR